MHVPHLHMTDPDNRDDAGASFEITGSAQQIAEYLSNVVINDVRPGSEHLVHEAASLLRSGAIEKAIPAAHRVGIYITEE